LVQNAYLGAVRPQRFAADFIRPRLIEKRRVATKRKLYFMFVHQAQGERLGDIGELRMALRIVVVLQVPMCLEVERNVARMLGDRYDVLAKGAGDAGFVKDVWVLAGEVAYDDVGAVD
jgi:hypothetical protein